LYRQDVIVVIGCEIKNSLVALFNVVTVVIQHAKTDFWTLEVLQHGNVTATRRTCFTNPLELVKPLFVGAVAKVKSKTIYTSVDQFGDLLLARRNWT
jgi:hypothetical protein